MDKLKYIKIERVDGSLSDSIPLTADAVNVTMANGNSAEDEINSKINENELNNVKNNLQNQISGLASGSPKGVYETVEMLKTTNPDTGVYIVSGNGHIYSWTKNQSGDPVDLGVYQAAEDSETVELISKNSFDNIESINLLNFESNINDKGLRDNGSVTDVADSFVTDFIELPRFEENTYIHSTVKMYKCCFYDNDKNFIEFSTRIFTVPLKSSYKYVRLMVEPSSTGVSYTDNFVVYINKYSFTVDCIDTFSDIVLGNEKQRPFAPIKINYLNSWLQTIVSRNIKKSDYLLKNIGVTWKHGGHNGYGIPDFKDDPEIITTNQCVYIPKGLKACCKKGYKFKILKLDENLGLIGETSDFAKWYYENDVYEFENGGYYLFDFTRYPLNDMDISESENFYIYSECKDISNRLVKGEPLNLKRQSYSIKNANFTLPNVSGRQACDIANGVLFQLTSDENCVLKDIKTNEIINSYSITCAHGNSCQFSNEYYYSNDKYPLLYVGGWQNDYVYVNRVTDNGATLIKTYDLSELNSYRHNSAISHDGKYLFTLSYHNNNTYLENNYSILSIWDTTKTTEVSSGVLKPKLLKSIEMPLIVIQQDMKWFNGKLYVTSGLYSDDIVRIRAFNTDGVMVSEIDNLPTSLSENESEGLMFYWDETSDKYRMYLTTGSSTIVNEIVLSN